MRIGLVVLSFLLLGSTLICGLWMTKQPRLDPSSVSFHGWLALISVAVVAVTMVVLARAGK